MLTNTISRRGVYPINGIPAQPSEVLCLYNNNPYGADTGLRDDETARLRTRLDAAGIRELAYATYPAESEYTYAMLLAVGAEQLPVVREFIGEVASKSYELLTGKNCDVSGAPHIVSQERENES
jgi:hypothetical protein